MFKRLFVQVLCLALLNLGSPLVAQAGLIGTLQAVETDTRAQDLATAITTELKVPADLDKAAAKRGLKVQESAFFTRNEPIPGLGASPEVSEQAFTLDAEGWRKLTLRWGLFFLFLAVLNEVVWRSFSTDFWVAFKVWGTMPITLAFTMSQMPLILRHGSEKPSA